MLSMAKLSAARQYLDITRRLLWSIACTCLSTMPAFCDFPACYAPFIRNASLQASASNSSTSCFGCARNFDMAAILIPESCLFLSFWDQQHSDVLCGLYALIALAELRKQVQLFKLNSHVGAD